MKVRISLTVDIDPEAWERNYGLDARETAAMREDVRAYCIDTIREQLEIVGVGK